jgi:hypothetical protein
MKIAIIGTGRVGSSIAYGELIRNTPRYRELFNQVIG